MPKSELKSNDLGIVAGLICAGIDYQYMERNGKIIYFVFMSDTDDITTTVNAYWNDKLLVSALQYQGVLRRLKHLCYNAP